MNNGADGDRKASDVLSARQVLCLPADRRKTSTAFPGRRIRALPWLRRPKEVGKRNNVRVTHAGYHSPSRMSEPTPFVSPGNPSRSLSYSSTSLTMVEQIVAGLAIVFIAWLAKRGISFWRARKRTRTKSGPVVPQITTVPAPPESPPTPLSVPSVGPRFPEVTDEELWTLREMETFGGRATHGFIALRGGSGKTGAIFIGGKPVDANESGWVYRAITGSLKDKGFVDVQGNDYKITPHGERALSVHRNRSIGPLPPVIDARTGLPRE